MASTESTGDPLGDDLLDRLDNLMIHQQSLTGREEVRDCIDVAKRYVEASRGRRHRVNTLCDLCGSKLPADRLREVVEYAREAGLARVKVGDIEVELAPVVREPVSILSPRLQARLAAEGDAATVDLGADTDSTPPDFRHAHTSMRAPDLAALRKSADEELERKKRNGEVKVT